MSDEDDTTSTSVESVIEDNIDNNIGANTIADKDTFMFFSVQG